MEIGKPKLKALTEASHKLAEAMYKKEGQAQGGCNSGNCNTKQDDDVIDAEVE